MPQRVERAGLQVDAILADFIEQRALPGTDVDRQAFWTGFASLIDDFGPQNRALLDRRDTLQTAIDTWHRARRSDPFDHLAYAEFLRQIGYLLPEGEDFQIDTANVDPEIATQPGPQLVVPITNAR